MSGLPQYTGPYNTKRPLPDGESRISIYGYVPSNALAITAIVCFGLAFVLHAFYFIRHRTTRTFQFLLSFGCLMELVGYGFRKASAANPFVVNSFIIQYFMIVCAPVFFTAALYLSLSIAVRQHDPRILPLRPKVVVIVFVVIDVVTTALQVLGAAFIGVSESARSQGKVPFIQTDAANDILLTGLSVQSASFLVFLILVVVTMRRNSKLSVSDTHGDSSVAMTADTEKSGLTNRAKIPTLFFIVLITSSLAVWLRTLFRLAETAEGVFGYASVHESLFGSLEFAPVIIALSLWAIRPLAKLLA